MEQEVTWDKLSFQQKPNSCQSIGFTYGYVPKENEGNIKLAYT